jgi:hypothetical protein
MFFRVDEVTRQQAKTPHELAMVNLILFNLLIGVALLAGSMAQPDSLIARAKWIAVGVPLAVSLAVIGFTWLRAARIDHKGYWFIAAHWRLAASRYRLLLLAYLVCAATLGIGAIGGNDESRLESHIRNLPPAMQTMERRKLASQDMGTAVWARIGVVPLVLATMVSIMLESGAIYQATRGEIPDGLVDRFPPPSDLIGTDQAN